MVTPSTDATEWVDTDDDAVGNNGDDDDDGDGALDEQEIDCGTDLSSIPLCLLTWTMTAFATHLTTRTTASLVKIQRRAVKQ